MKKQEAETGLPHVGMETLRQAALLQPQSPVGKPLTFPVPVRWNYSVRENAGEKLSKDTGLRRVDGEPNEHASQDGLKTMPRSPSVPPTRDKCYKNARHLETTFREGRGERRLPVIG